MQGGQGGVRTLVRPELKAHPWQMLLSHTPLWGPPQEPALPQPATVPVSTSQRTLREQVMAVSQRQVPWVSGSTCTSFADSSGPAGQGRLRIGPSHGHETQQPRGSSRQREAGARVSRVGALTSALSLLGSLNPCLLLLLLALTTGLPYPPENTAES